MSLKKKLSKIWITLQPIHALAAAANSWPYDEQTVMFVKRLNLELEPITQLHTKQNKDKDQHSFRVQKKPSLFLLQGPEVFWQLQQLQTLW